MRREYKLAPDLIRWADREPRREILEITEDSRRSVIVVVANADAMDVRDALARVYQDGREDNAPHFHSAGYGEPCYCPSSLTYAPQGRSEYGTEEEQR